jgi:hypothetical protein
MHANLTSISYLAPSHHVTPHSRVSNVTHIWHLYHSRHCQIVSYAESISRAFVFASIAPLDMDGCSLVKKRHPVGQGFTQSDSTQWEDWEKPTTSDWQTPWHDSTWIQHDSGSAASSSSHIAALCRQCGSNAQYQELVTCQVCSATNTFLNEGVKLFTGHS